MSLIGLPNLLDSAERFLKIYYVLMNKFESLPDHGNIFLIIMNVILNIFRIVVQNLPSRKMQLLAALYPSIPYPFFKTIAAKVHKMIHI